MEKSQFDLAGVRPVSVTQDMPGRKQQEKRPLLSLILLCVILAGCLGCNLIMTRDPAYMELSSYNMPPNQEFLFGTDTMGRDIFSMIWYGGRVSLTIGVTAATVSALLAIVYGAVSGLAPAGMDELMMRLIEILLSVPSLLLVILIQAVMGQATVWSLSFVLGISNWFGIAKVVRTEVRQLRSSEYVIAARCMGAGFFRVLWGHLTPNFFPVILFMVVMNVHKAIIAESTLSFIGVGLPLEIISWGSMLALSEKALLTGSWWILLIPGIFLVTTLVCITNIGNYLRSRFNQLQSYL